MEDPLAAILLLALGVMMTTPGPSPASSQSCSIVTVTAYASEDYPGLAADNQTPTRGNEGVIAAGGSNYPMGSYVSVEGLGSYRIADRGHLAASQIDVLMVTHAAAMQWGRQQRRVCRL
jgi:3D (Asp-Asp-Asp) domain-containing protein